MKKGSPRTEEVLRQIPVQVVQQIDVPVPPPFVQKEKNFVETPQVQMIERPCPVPSGMTQEVLTLVAVFQVQIVDVPVVHIDRIVELTAVCRRQEPTIKTSQKTVKVTTEIPQERVQQRTLEQNIDVPVPPTAEETVEVPRERISACIVEQVIDVPVWQKVGETTTVVELAPHERVQQRTFEEIATDSIAVAPVVMQRQRPAIQQSQKTVWIPQLQTVEQILEVPEIQTRWQRRKLES